MPTSHKRKKERKKRKKRFGRNSAPACAAAALVPWLPPAAAAPAPAARPGVTSAAPSQGTGRGRWTLVRGRQTVSLLATNAQLQVSCVLGCQSACGQRPSAVSALHLKVAWQQQGFAPAAQALCRAAHAQTGGGIRDIAAGVRLRSARSPPESASPIP